VKKSLLPFASTGNSPDNSSETGQASEKKEGELFNTRGGGWGGLLKEGGMNLERGGKRRHAVAVKGSMSITAEETRKGRAPAVRTKR